MNDEPELRHLSVEEVSNGWIVKRYSPYCNRIPGECTDESIVAVFTDVVSLSRFMIDHYEGKEMHIKR